MIDELVRASADKAGLTPPQARMGLSAALALIQKHGDPAKVTELLGAVPGSAALAGEGAALTESRGGGLVGGLMRSAGGASGAAMSDAMAVGQRLAREGVNLSDMQAILPTAMIFVRENTGRDLLREVLATVPGLGPILSGQG